ncbi:MAG: pentapeptide repeat-containing protein [Pseudomonadota bacterium]
MADWEAGSNGGAGTYGARHADDDPRLRINPYSLIVGVNEASHAARAAWLLSLAIMAWLFVAVAGVTHKDLLVGTGIALPLLQVEIDLKRLFIFAPLVILFIQFGLLVQHALLAAKLCELDGALRSEEAGRDRVHPLRLELSTYFLAQNLAGPERHPVLERVQHIISWMSLVFFPLLLLLVIQIYFLPYRDEAMTMGHRLSLFVYAAMLAAIGVFIMRPGRSYGEALGWALRHRSASVIATLIAVACFLGYATFLATINSNVLDRFSVSGAGQRLKAKLVDVDAIRPVRKLQLAGTDMVRNARFAPDEVSVDLKGRNLSEAIFTNADFKGADFSGALLKDAVFAGADLRFAKFGCDSQRSDFVLNTQRAGEYCTDMRSADLTNAKLDKAVFEFANLRLATLTVTELAKARVLRSNFAFATFYGPTAGRAEPPRPALKLPGSRLVNATMVLLDLRGADFSGADLRKADLSASDLRGADLSGADLRGALLEGTKLRGANLKGAKLDRDQLARADRSE